MQFRILKMIATSGLLTAPGCTKFALDPAGGAYSAPPDPLAGLSIPYFYGEEKGRKVESRSPLCVNSYISPWGSGGLLGLILLILIPNVVQLLHLTYLTHY